MARYYLDNYHRFETCIIDRENKTIHIHKPTTFIALHRELADIFDGPDWIIDIAPTIRYNDQSGEVLPPWVVDNHRYVDGTLVRWNEDNE
jgi:hypothetical protein